MGNCTPKASSRRTAASGSGSRSSEIVIYGSDYSPESLRVRLALLYRCLPFRFVSSDDAASAAAARLILRLGPDEIHGCETILAYIDSMFPDSAAAATVKAGEEAAWGLAAAAVLHHRSVERQMAAVVKRTGEMEMTAAEERRVVKAYAVLAETMVEHAQMEERLLFPSLENATRRGMCKKATEEHAKELPLINGIKEDMKSLLSMHTNSSFYKEALLNLSLRLTCLQEQCKEHFVEEERELLPLMKVAEVASREEGEDPAKWVEQMIELMESTHSRNFTFFMSFLVPHEAMQYLNLLCRSTIDKKRLVSMLRSLILFLQGMKSSPAGYTTPTYKSYLNFSHQHS